MTNKLEISREHVERLAERLSKAQMFKESSELRALLAAQVVERKPEGRRERFQKWVLATEHPVLGFLDGHWLERGDDREGYANEYVQGLWVAFKEFADPTPPLIQTLHANGDRIAMEATIAQLRQLLATRVEASRLDEANEVIAQQAQRIADLERGRGEPVAYRIQAFSETGHLSRHALSWRSLAESMELHDFKEWIGNYRAEETPLYAEQPAPVAVVLPTILSTEQGPHYSDNLASELGYLAGYNACLDKVKELNQ